MAVERLRTCDDVNELAQELGVTRRCLHKWRVKLETIEPGEDASRPSTHTSSYRKQTHQLKRMLAEKVMEVDFFKGALQKVEARRQKEAMAGLPSALVQCNYDNYKAALIEPGARPYFDNL